MQKVTPLQPQTALVNQPKPGGASPYSGIQPVKLPPAPGNSPVGGTTHLPQYLNPATNPMSKALASPGLQTGLVNPGSGSNNPYNHPVAGATQQPGGVTAPPPASTPPGAVPPPPPPPVPPTPPVAPGSTPPEQKPGVTDQNDQMGKALWEHLMEQLQNSGRYNNAATNAEREYGTRELEDKRNLSEQQAKIDAMNRGVYYGTPLTNSLGDIGERYNRGLGDMETKLVADNAANMERDRQAAIQQILQYGQLQQNGQGMDNELWLKLLELSNQSPQFPNTTSAG